MLFRSAVVPVPVVVLVCVLMMVLVSVVVMVLVSVVVMVLVPMIVSMLVAMMVLMPMLMAQCVVLLLAVDQNGHMGALNAALDGPLGGKRHPRQAQRVHPPEEVLRLGVKLQQGRHEHVAGGPHGAV